MTLTVLYLRDGSEFTVRKEHITGTQLRTHHSGIIQVSQTITNLTQQINDIFLIVKNAEYS